jgi:thiamine-phosphate pyrophosphorylase
VDELADRPRAPVPALWLITDRKLATRPLLDVVEDCLGAGLRAVQLREKDLPVHDLMALAAPLRESTRRHGARLLLNDRLDTALAAEADGVQRTGASLPVATLRRLAPPPVLIGASVHSLDEAVGAEADGADFVVFGPVYDTASKRQYGAPQGLERLAQVTAAVRRPVIAVGGIDPGRTTEVLAAGASGVAAIGAFLTAERPGDVVKGFLDALGRA